jgi:hypothetical protein
VHDRGTRDAPHAIVAGDSTIIGVAPAAQRAEAHSDTGALTRALDAPVAPDDVDLPDVPTVPAARGSDPVVPAYRGEGKRHPHRFFAFAAAEPETTVCGGAASVVALPMPAPLAPARASRPHGRVLVLFACGMLFGLVFGLVVILALVNQPELPAAPQITSEPLAPEPEQGKSFFELVISAASR